MKALKQPEETFWVVNISDRNVSLTDLGLTIPARKNVNLLDKKHYYLTKEQLLASAESGSLFKKRDKVVVRKVPPIPEKKKFIEVQQMMAVPSRARSVVVIEDIKYEELHVSDDTFAQENSDIAEQDHLGKWAKK